jgi:hypothetical protein
MRTYPPQEGYVHLSQSAVGECRQWGETVTYDMRSRLGREGTILDSTVRFGGKRRTLTVNAAWGKFPGLALSFQGRIQVRIILLTPLTEGSRGRS